MSDSEAGTSSDGARESVGEYQVFLSFRGPDTRYGFTDFLCDYLEQAGVRVFQDNNELQVGEVIGDNLRKAINSSIIYIPIFSQTYASSRWCLRELVHIVDNESKSKGRKCILPIFFLVKPEDVKLRTPLYRNAFLEHKKFPDEVEAWREALTKAGKIKGWNVEKNQSQTMIVKLVVKRVLEELEIKQKPLTEQLVRNDRVKKLRELLHVNHGDVRLVGIYGMGGIGKTTIAKVVFNELCSHFGRRCSFLDGVRERSSKEGIVQLQKKLLSDMVDTKSAKEVKDTEGGMRRIGETFPTEKVLVVLDDVNEKEQIMKLIGNSKLHSGSRIIITTRDTSILQIEGFEGEIRLYEMLKMDDSLALQLFCRHAFDMDFPLVAYRELSREIISRMGGLPLAIEVVGSLLKGKSEAFWKETLARLKKEPEEAILKKLRISYDALDKYQKQIFLDIACFFLNEKKTDAIYMWADSLFYPERGINVLSSRCLMKIVDNDRFWMHDQLIDLGRQIVREESQDDLGKQSRLWNSEEALQIIRTKERKHEVHGLEIHEPFEITSEDFERLPKLRFLYLNRGTYAGDFATCHSNLRWLSWHSPRDFRADKLYLDRLVVCKLYQIHFKDDSKAWDLIKGAQNLKVLCITQCNSITTIPDFSKCSGLERLTLAECYSLKKIESFIGNLQSLIELKIEECRNFTNLPEEVGELVKLKHFSLLGCQSLTKLPESLGNLGSLMELDLSSTSIGKLPNSIDGLVKLESFIMENNIIKELPDSIGKLKSLRVLRLTRNASIFEEDHVWQLPSGIGTLVNLEELDLSRQHVTGEFPIEIEELSSLKILKLNGTRICRIPRTINKLHRLQSLDLRWCDEIQELPELPSSLTCLLFQSKSLLSVPNLSNLINLVELELSNHEGPLEDSKPFKGGNLRWIGRLFRLKRLALGLANVPAPLELVSLSHLEELSLSHLDLKAFEQLPSSERNASTLNLSQCEVEDISLNGLLRLKKLWVRDCKRIQRLSIPSELRKLQQVYVYNCPELVEIQVVVGLSKSLGILEISECNSLTRISGLSYLKNLKNLVIERCNALANVEGLNELESLKFLKVTCCMSLRQLIDASCTKIPDDCTIIIPACGDFVKDSHLTKHSLKSYKEEILLDKSNKVEHPFTIIFHHGYMTCSEGFGIVGGAELKRVNVSPDSVTYEGLIAKIKRLKSMWYNAAAEYPPLLIEIKSDEQVKGMVQVASKRGFIRLYVEVNLDIKWSFSRSNEDSDSTSKEGSSTEIQIETVAKVRRPATGIVSSSRNSKASRFGTASTSGKDTASNFGRGTASSSRNSAPLSIGRSRGSTSEKDTTLSSGRAMTVSTGTGESEIDGISSIDDFQSELGNAECLEATGYRRQMRAGMIQLYGSVDRRKTASVENRKKDKDEIGGSANQNNVVRSSCQRFKVVEHCERSYKATTTVEDQRDLSSVKRDRTEETYRVLAKTGRGSVTGCASNPGSDPANRARGRGIASSSRNNKGLRVGTDAASTLGKGTTSNLARDVVSSSQSSTTSRSGKAKGSTSQKGTTLSSGRGKDSSSRTDTTKMGIASGARRGISSSSRSSTTLSTGRGRGSTSGEGTSGSSGRGTTSSLVRGTTKMGTSLRLGMTKGSSLAKAKP